MKRISWVFLIALIAIVSSCSSTRISSADKVIKNTFWVNLTPATLGDQNGTLVNSLYFTGDNKVIMKTGVTQDSTVVEKPLFSNFGNYKCSGNLKKGISLTITTDIATIGKKIDYKGLITSEGMVLIEPDSTSYVYFPIQLTQK